MHQNEGIPRLKSSPGWPSELFVACPDTCSATMRVVASNTSNSAEATANLLPYPQPEASGPEQDFKFAQLDGRFASRLEFQLTRIAQGSQCSPKASHAAHQLCLALGDCAWLPIHAKSA